MLSTNKFQLTSSSTLRKRDKVSRGEEPTVTVEREREREKQSILKLQAFQNQQLAYHTVTPKRENKIKF